MRLSLNYIPVKVKKLLESNIFDIYFIAYISLEICFNLIKLIKAKLKHNEGEHKWKKIL